MRGGYSRKEGKRNYFGATPCFDRDRRLGYEPLGPFKSFSSLAEREGRDNGAARSASPTGKEGRLARTLAPSTKANENASLLWRVVVVILNFLLGRGLGPDPIAAAQPIECF